MEAFEQLITTDGKLKCVRLIDSTLSSEQCQQIMDSIARYQTIGSLEIINCRFQENALMEIARGLPSSNLVVFKLVHVRFPENVCIAFANEMKKCKLKKIEFYNNTITLDGFKSLSSIINDIKLEHFSVGRNYLGADGGNQLAKVLMEKKHCLRFLDLRLCRIGTDSIINIVNALEGNKTLEGLQLGYNHVLFRGVQALCRLLPSSNIKALSLSGNDLNDVSILNLSMVIEQNPCMKLKILCLDSNRITVSCIKRLFGAIEQNQSIQVIDIRQNPDIENCGEYIFNCIKTHISLTTLRLAGTGIPLQIQDKVCQRVKILHVWRSKILIILCYAHRNTVSRLTIIPVELMRVLGNYLPLYK